MASNLVEGMLAPSLRLPITPWKVLRGPYPIALPTPAPKLTILDQVHLLKDVFYLFYTEMSAILASTMFGESRTPAPPHPICRIMEVVTDRQFEY
jgi:hypothetical protein